MITSDAIVESKVARYKITLSVVNYTFTRYKINIRIS